MIYDIFYMTNPYLFFMFIRIIYGGKLPQFNESDMELLRISLNRSPYNYKQPI
jgi:hypothetical protein